MSLPHPPPRPTEGDYGLTAEVIFMQAVWDLIWDPKTNIFCDHPNIQFSKTTKGYLPRIRIPAAKETKSSAQTNFQGVYVPGVYNAFDEVVIQAGPGQGEYVCLADNNTNAPTTGINWIQVSSLNQWF